MIPAVVSFMLVCFVLCLGFAERERPADTAEISDAGRRLLTNESADLLSGGGALEHTSGPDWRQRVQVAAALAVIGVGVLAVAILAGLAVGALVGALAEAFGARFLS